MSRSTDVPAPHISCGLRSRARYSTTGPGLATAARFRAPPFAAVVRPRVAVVGFGLTVRADLAGAGRPEVRRVEPPDFDTAGRAAFDFELPPRFAGLAADFAGEPFFVVRRTSVTFPDFLTLPTPAPTLCNGRSGCSGNFRYLKL